jgi:methionine-S-sulfoxide reductase
VLAGGCFWGMEDLIRREPGILGTRVGYTGGSNDHATYRKHPGHAEAVEIVFDPSKTTYRDILAFFFQIHDPSTRDRQGNDIGSSYRSAIFPLSPEQEQVARRPDQTPRASAANSLGLAVSDLPTDRLKEMRIRTAVRVDSVDGAAARVGVQVGDLILAVNNVEVQNAKQFNDFVSKLDVKRNVVLLIRRGEQSNFIVIRPQDRP